MKLGMMKFSIFAVTMAVSLLSGTLRAEEEQSKSDIPTWFAKIDGEVIGVDEFAANMREGIRSKFYHGAPPQSAMDSFKKEVAERVVLRHLQVKEALKRGLVADQSDVAQAVASMDERNQSRPDWSAIRVQVLPLVTKRAEEESLLKQLVQQVKQVKSQTNADVKRFYDENHSLFTSPKKYHVKIIMLKLDPGVEPVVRQQVKQRADAIVKQIAAGADFSKLARRHSSDLSASRGGDLGALHQGQLGAQLEHELESLVPGQVSDPIELLDGYAIVSLAALEQPMLSPFSQVEGRAKDLYLRDRADKQWESFNEKIRKQAVVEFNPEL